MSIILDLDHTCICSFFESSFEDPAQFETLVNQVKESGFEYDIVNSFNTADASLVGDAYVSRFICIYRPYLKKFITTCFEVCDQVIVWSAGQYRYVMGLCELIFNHIPFEIRQAKLTTILTAQHCEITEGRVVKDLNKHLSHISDPLVLDDREDAMSLNSDKGVLIPFFHYNGQKATSDKVFKILTTWLSKKPTKQTLTMYNQAKPIQMKLHVNA